MELQNSEEFKNSEIEEFEKPIEEIEKSKALSKIKKIFAKKTLTAIVLSGKGVKKYLKNKTAIAVISLAAIGTLAFTSYEYFQLRKNYNEISKKFSQVEEENLQLKQEQEQLNQEHVKTLEDLTQDYNLALQEQEQLKQQNQGLANDDKQAKQQYEQLNQQYNELDKKFSQIEKEHNKTLQETDILANAVRTLTRENEKLKQQLEEKITSELEKITVEPYKKLSYSSGYGFLDYTEGLLNLQHNWQSSDILENKGWQVINKKNINVLSFKPVSDFNDFSPEDNYATFYIHTEKPISSFMIWEECYIQKNGYLNIFISGDNKNWAHFQYFDSRGRDDYRVAWGHTPYYPEHWEKRGLKLDKDFYIRHSAGAESNKDYEVEIWRVSFSVDTK